MEHLTDWFRWSAGGVSEPGGEPTKIAANVITFEI